MEALFFTAVLTLVSSFIVSSVVKWWYRMKISDFGRKINQLPGPRPLPFLGSFLEISWNFHRRLYFLQEDLVKKYGDIYRIIVGNRVTVYISSPVYIETLLSSQVHLNKADSYKHFGEWLGDGLLVSTGSKWQVRRRLLTPAFRFQILEDSLNVFNEQSRILVGMLVKSIMKDLSHDIDVYPFISRCALDIVCETAMGVPTHAQTCHSEYVGAVYRILHLIEIRRMAGWMQMGALFPLTTCGREYKRTLSILHSFTRDVIEERKKKLLVESTKENGGKAEKGKEYEQPKKTKTFLDWLLLNAQNVACLTDADIRDEVNTFMFGGHDTVSDALSWFLYLIAKHPEKQNKVYTELKEVFGDSDRPCTSKDVSRLKYLECCIKETLRLLPSVPIFERRIDEQITLGEYTVPPGSSVAVLPYAVHCNPRYFLDPDSYRPERFLPENSVGRHPYCFVPFSAGPRNCIGQSFALSEEKVILSTLLRKFRFELSVNTQFDPCLEVTLKPNGGMILKLLPRH